MKSPPQSPDWRTPNEALPRRLNELIDRADDPGQLSAAGKSSSRSVIST